MQTLTVDFIASLDGYGAAEGWPGWWGLEGPEYFQWLDSQPEAAVVMGATTYRLMSAFAAAGEAGTGPLDGVTKYVFSGSLTQPLAWANSVLVPTPAPQDAITAALDLKERSPLPLRTLGSVALSASLLRAGLVDRFRVVLFPVVTGATGTDRIFEGWPDVGLELVDHAVLDGRLQMLEYVPTVLSGPPAPPAP